MSKMVDLLRLTAVQLQDLLSNGKITTVELIKQTLDQIEKHNRNGLNLRAIISVVPRELALQKATQLDLERERGHIRGPFHGIPVIVKDLVRTHHDMGMPTTLGSWALADSMSDENATIVDRMVDAGMIIVGKSNLNLSSWKSMGPMNGWSALGGQTNSAYVKGGLDQSDGLMGHTNPCGSSTGSAVGVSAGMSPIGVGTEIDGSIVQPAARAGLYALKPTVGTTDLKGIFSISEDFDSVSAVAKCTADLAMMTELFIKVDMRDRIPQGGFRSCLKQSFSGMRIGFVDPEVWRWPDKIQPPHANSKEQIKQAYLEVMDLVRKQNGVVAYPIEIPLVSKVEMNGSPATVLAMKHVAKRNVDSFLKSYGDAKVRSFEELIEYNKKHSDRELPPDFPEQDKLIDTLEHPVDHETYRQAINLCRKVGREQGIDRAVKEHNVDIVCFPMDSPCPRVAAAAGYPIATAPLGTLDYNGRPFGIAAIAQAHREDALFAFLSAFESNHAKRPVPAGLDDKEIF